MSLFFRRVFLFVCVHIFLNYFVTECMSQKSILGFLRIAASCDSAITVSIFSSSVHPIVGLNLYIFNPWLIVSAGLAASLIVSNIFMGFKVFSLSCGRRSSLEVFEKDYIAVSWIHAIRKLIDSDLLCLNFSLVEVGNLLALCGCQA